MNEKLIEGRSKKLELTDLLVVFGIIAFIIFLGFLFIWPLGAKIMGGIFGIWFAYHLIKAEKKDSTILPPDSL